MRGVAAADQVATRPCLSLLPFERRYQERQALGALPEVQVQVLRADLQRQDGTIFQGSRPPLKVWFSVALLQRRMSILKVSQALGMYY